MAKATMTFEVGRLVARGIERALRAAAHGRVDLTIERDMGWLEGVLLVTAEGESDRVMAFVKAAEGMTLDA